MRAVVELGEERASAVDVAIIVEGVAYAIHSTAFALLEEVRFSHLLYHGGAPRGVDPREQIFTTTTRHSDLSHDLLPHLAELLGGHDPVLQGQNGRLIAHELFHQPLLRHIWPLSRNLPQITELANLQRWRQRMQQIKQH